MIRDPIIRATYIKDCSQRIGIAEQTLISQLNKFIHNERTSPQSQSGYAAQQGGNGNGTVSAFSATQVDTAKPTAADIHIDRRNKEQVRASAIERLIVQAIVRYGEEIIYKNIETEDGESVNLSVAEYVYYDLKADNTLLSNPLYNKIIEEAVAHVGEEGFKAETFFLHHHDINISQLASTLSVDDFNLSKSLQLKYEEDTLRNQVRHIILEYRRNIVDMQLNQLLRQLSQNNGNSDDVMNTMAQIQQLQEKRNTFAKYLGNNVFS